MTLYQEKLYSANISISSAGDNLVIGPGAASSPDFPASWDNSATYIAIDFISFIPNVTTTVQLYSGKSSGEGTQTALGGALSIMASQPLTWENAIEHYQGILTLGPNQSFVINLSGAGQVSGIVRYRILQSN